MTTQEKASELVQDLGIDHTIYVTEEILTILEDWEGTELAQKDWIEIKEIIRSIEPITFKPFKEQILVQSSIDGEVIWEDKQENEDRSLLELILDCREKVDAEVPFGKEDAYNIIINHIENGK